MQKICMWCSSELDTVLIHQKALQPITNGLCPICAADVLKQNNNNNLIRFLDGIGAPILLMQGNPRQVATANKKACTLFGKELSSIEQHRGGQVFDCVHSFTEAGCGKDIHCENCPIKNAVVETFTTGAPFNGVSTVLEIKRQDTVSPHDMQVTTEKVGDYVLLKINRYERKF